MRHPPRHRQGRVSTEEPLLIPRGKKGRQMVDFIPVVLREGSHQHHLLEHVVGRIVRWLKESEGRIADMALHVVRFDESRDLLRLRRAQELLPLGFPCRVLQFRPSFQKGCRERHVAGFVFQDRHGLPRHHVEPSSILSDPFLEAIGIKLLDVL